MTSTEFSLADATVVPLLRNARAQCDEADGPLLTRLTAGLARVLPAGDQEAHVLAATAVAMARRSQDDETLAVALSAAVLITWSPDNLPWRLAATDEVILLADSLGWIELAMEARNWRAAMSEERADLAAADVDLQTMEAWTAGSRRPFFKGLVAMRRAARSLLQGRYHDAEDQAAAILVAAGDNADFVAGFGAHLFLMRRDQGRLGELDALVAEQVINSPQIPAWRVAQAVVHAELGRRQAALAELELLTCDGMVVIPRDWLWLLATTLLADLCSDLDAREPAVQLAAILTPFEDRVAVLGHGIASLGAVSGPLGRLEVVLGRWSDAQRHLDSAVALNEQLGALPALARVHAAYADLLVQRDGDADRRAAEHVEAARTIAVGIGMTGLDLRPQEIRKASSRS
jgi:hypothetical protein